MSLPHNDIEELINAIYPGINQANLPDQFFLERTILSSKNDTVDQLNQLILDRYVKSVHISQQSVSSFIILSLGSLESSPSI